MVAHHEDFQDALPVVPQKNVIHIKKTQKFGLVIRSALQDETNRIVKDLDKKFQQQYRKTFTKQFKKSSSLPSEAKGAKTVAREIERQMSQASHKM